MCYSYCHLLQIKENSGSPGGQSDGAFEDLLQQVAQLKVQTLQSEFLLALVYVLTIVCSIAWEWWMSLLS